MIRPLAVLVLALLGHHPLDAQAPAPLDAAAGTITPSDFRARLEILAHDSMMGRATPSPGLERAAAYVIRELQRLGLRPAGDSGTYVQHWGLSRWTVDTARSTLELSSRATRVTLSFGGAVRWIDGGFQDRPAEGDAVLVGGPVTPAVTRDPRLRNRVVLLVTDYRQPLPEDLGDRVDEIAAVARAVVIVSNRHASTFADRVTASLEPRRGPDFRDADGGVPVVEVLEEAVGGLAMVAAVDLSRVRAGDSTVVRELPELRVRIAVARRYLERAAAPNVVAVLEGRDPRLRREYVAISAHLDHLGVRRTGTADSILNGADDNASGVAGLLELAEAFSRPEARPARSLLFLLPSGEEEGLWGSAYFVRHPTVPLDRVVAGLNMDLIGRNWTDSVIVTGPEMSTLGETLHRVAAARPELRMAPVADRWPQERIFYRSDHYNFALAGVPVLFFTSGTHADYHQPTDAADRIDSEKASRLVRYVFHVGAAVADDPARPRWNPGSYERLVEERR